jgi:hypothetical protein
LEEQQFVRKILQWEEDQVPLIKKIRTVTLMKNAPQMIKRIMLKQKPILSLRASLLLLLMELLRVELLGRLLLIP